MTKTPESEEDRSRRAHAALARMSARAQSKLRHAERHGLGPPVGWATIEDDGFRGEIPLWHRDIEELQRDDFAPGTITVVVNPN